MLHTLLSPMARGKLTVLLFHKVPQSVHPLDTGELTLVQFERVLSLACRLFRILPLDDALRALQQDKLPARSACITFDDGYPEWVQGAVPLLERFKAHATFFVTTGQFKGLPMWNERILHAVAAAAPGCPALVLPGTEPLELGSERHRMQAIRSLDAYLKYKPPAEKEQLLHMLEAHTGVLKNAVPVMSPEDVRLIHAKGFGVGAHAVSHPILSACSPKEAYGEIAGAREDLESIIRAPVKAFAYPNGVPLRDFGSEHVEMVRRAGYSHALTTDRGVADRHTSPYQVPRFTPWGPSQARMKLQFIRNLMQKVNMLPEGGTDGKKALMVAFHFPPQAGSSGILRTLNFAKNLPANGWQPFILTAQPRAYEEFREDLLKEIPETTKVIRAFALDSARHLSIRGKYPTAIALPDRWASWWPFAVWTGLTCLRRERPDLIWSTYPISTAHLIGFSLAKLSGLPWIADFRDPMINGDYPSHPMQRRVWFWLESRVMRYAQRCVFTTERAAQAYRQRYPQWADKCTVIENGYDEAAFEGNLPVREGMLPGQRLLLHSGIIYPRDRDPEPFLSAISSLLETGQIERASIKVRFRAPRHDEEVMALVNRHELQGVVEVAPPIPYREAIAEMMGADLLLVFQGSHFNTQIPAKIYEYLRTGRPVLGLLDPAGDTAQQLKRFRGVQLADIDDVQSIASALQSWAHNSPDIHGAVMNTALVQRYSRVAQAGALAELMHACLMRHGQNRRNIP